MVIQLSNMDFTNFVGHFLILDFSSLFFWITLDSKYIFIPDLLKLTHPMYSRQVDNIQLHFRLKIRSHTLISPLLLVISWYSTFWTLFLSITLEPKYIFIPDLLKRTYHMYCGPVDNLQLHFNLKIRSHTLIFPILCGISRY